MFVLILLICFIVFHKTKLKKSSYQILQRVYRLPLLLHIHVVTFSMPVVAVFNGACLYTCLLLHGTRREKQKAQNKKSISQQCYKQQHSLMTYIKFDKAIILILMSTLTYIVKPEEFRLSHVMAKKSLSGSKLFRKFRNFCFKSKHLKKSILIVSHQLKLKVSIPFLFRQNCYCLDH